MLLNTPAIAEVYKKTNPDGSIIYSDTPLDGGKAITPPGLTPTPSVKYPKKQLTVETPTDNKPLVYSTFEITSPKDQAIIRGNNGNLSLTIGIEPPLQTAFKHSISIILDGLVVKTDLKSNSFQLKNLDRGRHTLSARLLDAKKKVLKSSSTLTVHIKRHSALHGKKPRLWPEYPSL